MSITSTVGAGKAHGAKQDPSLTWLGVPRGGRGAFLFLGVLFFSLTDDWLGEDVCRDTRAEGTSHLKWPPSFLTHRPGARGWGQH